jgi:hypothetical protein
MSGRTERRFVNERDREIIISVEDRPARGIRIEIEGPFSRSTNTITDREATELRDALIEHLGRPS